MVYSVVSLCKVMTVSRSAYYAWLKRPAKLITEQELMLYRRCKSLFNASRQSAGARTLMKLLRKEGFTVGIYRVRSLMMKMNLVVKQRIAYKVTTLRKHSHLVADNVLNRQFNPGGTNQVWAGDISYLRTHQGWMYLAIVMDLHSRRIVGWAMNKRMTVDLTMRAFHMAVNLRQPTHGLLFHSDRGSQYTSKRYQTLLKNNNVTTSMSGRGACLDNAVVERFFGSLKNEWLLHVPHPSRNSMQMDVEKYIKYYNAERLHTTLNDMSPIEFENVKEMCAA